MYHDIIDRALGALQGSIIGDAFGGRYEFANKDLFTELNEKYIPILGGGVWKLTPGQITDDSELLLTLATALCKSEHIDMETIAKYYRNWYKSNPFDIGNTTRNSFSQETTQLMLEKSAQLSNKNEALSNGMLMRISPLAIVIAGYIYRNCNNQNIVNTNQFKYIQLLVSNDTLLTHYNKSAVNYTTAYVLLLAYAILDGNLDRGISTIKTYLSNTECYNIVKRGLISDSQLIHDPTQQMGDCRIAFQLAVRKGSFASQNTMTYQEAIISTVKLGGDTDTNACIVGGLVGAIVGSNNLPNEWLQTIKSPIVLNCKRYNDYPINKSVTKLDEIVDVLFKKVVNF